LVDFVEEVEEQLRSERYARLARQWLPWLAVALVAVIVGWLGVWRYDVWRQQKVGVASIAYDKALNALAAGDQTAAFSGFAAVGKSGPPGYKTLALMQEGNIRSAANQPREAAGFFDQASKAAPNPILKDLASFRAAQSIMDVAPYPEIEGRLKALIGDGKPYSFEAREMLAIAKLQAGMSAAARNEFSALSLTLGVSQGIRARAQAAIALIDSGQGAVVGQVVKAAATMPPSPAATVTPSANGPAADSAETPSGNAQ
jgi:hypothetical protein